MRLPIAANLESRDGAVDQDAKVVNGICEIKGQEVEVRNRPGCEDYGLVKVGAAQMLTSWRGAVRSVIADAVCGGPVLAAPYTNSTTYNSADKAANITLASGDLQVTASSVALGAVRTSASYSSGRWYSETTITTIGACYIGFATATYAISSADLINYGSIWYYPTTGALWALGVNLGTVATATDTDVIGFFVDIDAGLFYVFKNNTFIGGGAFTAGATLYGFIGTASTTADLITKFTGFAYTPALTQSALTVTTTNLPYWYAATGETAGTQYLAIANREFLWYISTLGTPTKVTDTDYPGNMTPARQTVPGIVYLDTYFFVMDTSGRIYNSASNDPTSWSALGFITASNEPGAGVAIGKTQNYVAAFKEYSVELFYDAANPVGSPLSPVESGFLKIGCASGTSVTQFDQSLIWVSQSRQAGRAVHIMTGIQSQKISTPDVERILNEDDLSEVHAFCIRPEGHDLYVLTLVNTGITLVYDFASQLWGQWTSLTTGSSKSISSITRSGTTATVNFAVSHTLNDGDPLTISGANQSDYNGTFQSSYVDADTVTIEVANSPTTPATGTILGYPYTESYFKFTKYTNFTGSDLLLHESDGHLYRVDPSLHQDNALPINWFARTSRLDGGELGKKKIRRVRLVGDKVSALVKIRWSDDDSASFTSYYDLDLSVDEPEVRRSKSFRRRSYELRYTGNNPVRLKALEIEVNK